MIDGWEKLVHSKQDIKTNFIGTNCIASFLEWSKNAWTHSCAAVEILAGISKMRLLTDASV